MHAPQWRVCLGELCRVAERLVVVDYPSRQHRPAAVGRPPCLSRSACARKRTACSPIARSPRRLRSTASRSVRGTASSSCRSRFTRRSAPPIHGRLRGALEPDWPAETVRVACHDRRRTVHALVTGATGFTGGHLARALAARGQRCGRSFGTPAVPAILEAEGIQLAVGDIRDRAALEAATAGVEVVYHIAAIYRQAGVNARSTGRSTRRPFGTSSKPRPRRRPARRSLQHRRRSRRHRASTGQRRRPAQAG